MQKLIRRKKPCKLNLEIMKNFYKGWDKENLKIIK